MPPYEMNCRRKSKTTLYSIASEQGFCKAPGFDTTTAHPGLDFVGLEVIDATFLSVEAPRDSPKRLDEKSRGHFATKNSLCLPGQDL